MPAGREQRALNLRRDLQLVLDAGLLERLPIEARVLDGHAGLGRQRVQGRPRRRRQQRTLLAAIEVEHARRLRLARQIGAIEIADESQRRAQDMADAERHGAHVRVGEIPVQQVRHDTNIAAGKDLLGNLAAHVEPAAREGDFAASTRQLHLELGAIVRQHDEAALGAGHLDGGVEHERQHLVEHAARAERTKALEQAGQLADVADGGRLMAVGDPRRGHIFDQKHDVGAGGASELNPIAMLERALGDLLAVDERAIARSAIFEHVGAVALGDFGVVARDVAASQAQVVLIAAADRNGWLVDRHDAAAESVVDFEAWA